MCFGDSCFRLGELHCILYFICVYGVELTMKSCFISTASQLKYDIGGANFSSCVDHVWITVHSILMMMCVAGRWFVLFAGHCIKADSDSVLGMAWCPVELTQQYK